MAGLLRTLLHEERNLLTFRPVGPAVARHCRAFLAFGLACTWLAGIGRYWDNPRAASWQHLGLGSLAYVFALALVLWLLAWPLRPTRWSYRNVLLFVSLTSPPALLYAIPVERWTDLPTAMSINAWFLAIVATWRVALLSVFLRTVGGLRTGPVVVATLLPLALIVNVLASLNLEHAVFQIMAGNDGPRPTEADVAYFVVLALTMVSWFATPFLVAAHAGYVIAAWKARRASAAVPDPSYHRAAREPRADEADG